KLYRQDGVVSHGECVHARAGLRVAVNDDGVGDDGQGGEQADGADVGRGGFAVGVGRGDVEGDGVEGRIEVRVGVGVRDGLAQRAGAVVVRVDDEEAEALRLVCADVLPAVEAARVAALVYGRGARARVVARVECGAAGEERVRLRGAAVGGERTEEWV